MKWMQEVNQSQRLAIKCSTKGMCCEYSGRQGGSLSISLKLVVQKANYIFFKMEWIVHFSIVSC